LKKWKRPFFTGRGYTVKKTFGFRGLGRLEYQGHASETDASIGKRGLKPWNWSC